VITKGLRDILVVNQSIIENLKAQKARADKILDKYQTLVRDEADLPSNRFLNWTRLLDPYSDSVISAKVTDYELIRRYEAFVKEIVFYEQNQLVDESYLQDMKELIVFLLDRILELEEVSNQVERNYRAKIAKIQESRITIYHKGHDREMQKGICWGCGIDLGEEETKTCSFCDCVFGIDGIIEGIKISNTANLRKAEIEAEKLSNLNPKTGKKFCFGDRFEKDSETCLRCADYRECRVEQSNVRNVLSTISEPQQEEEEEPDPEEVSKIFREEQTPSQEDLAEETEPITKTGKRIRVPYARQIRELVIAQLKKNGGKLRQIELSRALRKAITERGFGHLKTNKYIRDLETWNIVERTKGEGGTMVELRDKNAE
jgi:hypothetical protein